MVGRMNLVEPYSSIQLKKKQNDLRIRINNLHLYLSFDIYLKLKVNENLEIAASKPLFKFIYTSEILNTHLFFNILYLPTQIQINIVYRKPGFKCEFSRFLMYKYKYSSVLFRKKI